MIGRKIQTEKHTFIYTLTLTHSHIHTPHTHTHTHIHTPHTHTHTHLAFILYIATVVIYAGLEARDRSQELIRYFLQVPWTQLPVPSLLPALPRSTLACQEARVRSWGRDPVQDPQYGAAVS